MLLLGYLKKKNQNTNYNQKFKVTDLMKCSIFEEDQGQSENHHNSRLNLEHWNKQRGHFSAIATTPMIALIAMFTD